MKARRGDRQSSHDTPTVATPAGGWAGGRRLVLADDGVDPWFSSLARPIFY